MATIGTWLWADNRHGTIRKKKRKTGDKVNIDLKMVGLERKMAYEEPSTSLETTSFFKRDKYARNVVATPEDGTHMMDVDKRYLLEVV